MLLFVGVDKVFQLRFCCTAMCWVFIIEGPIMRMILRGLVLVAAALGISLAGNVSGARADVVVYLNNVSLSDGGSLSGSFVLNVDDYITESTVKVTTTVGGVLPGDTYTAALVAASINNVGGTGLPDDVVQFFSSTLGYQGTIQLTFLNPLTSLATYSTDPIIGGVGGLSWECSVGFGCPPYSGTPIRYVATEQFASAVPEPATWGMMVLGFLGLGFMAYRRNGRKSASSFRFA
jgi:hypothetical protein